ncbi:MAG: DUF1080 domain-containing protein [Verrucomicrobia bacterium]|nr:DUF1080 domain-containing protein [Verrucomicrobiota bacterium]
MLAALLADGCACCPFGAKNTTDSAAAKKKASPSADGWHSLFNGKSLTGWKVTEFGGGGDVKVDPKFTGGAPAIVIGAGASLSGITLTNPPPGGDYEVQVEAAKIEGSDFFCGITFPVGTNHATLVLGGWGGATVGVSSIDGMDASENETTKFIAFQKDKWHRIRLRVTKAKIEVWLDDEQIINQEITDRKITMRYGDIEMSIPFGIATYQTSSAVREIKWRPVPPATK